MIGFIELWISQSPSLYEKLYSTAWRPVTEFVSTQFNATRQTSHDPAFSRISERSLEDILKDARDRYDESETPFVRMHDQDGALPDLDRDLSLLLENVDADLVILISDWNHLKRVT